MQIDLACGQRPEPDHLGVDIVPGEGVDVVCDLMHSPWPFADRSVTHINCSHFVEHVPDLIAFMNEAWRVATLGCIFTIVHPYWTSHRAWMDPTHVRPLPFEAWAYYDRGWREREKLDHYPITANWKIVSADADLNPEWADKPPEEQKFAMSHYLDVASDMKVVLVADA